MSVGGSVGVLSRTLSRESRRGGEERGPSAHPSPAGVAAAGPRETPTADAPAGPPTSRERGPTNSVGAGSPPAGTAANQSGGRPDRPGLRRFEADDGTTVCYLDAEKFRFAGYVEDPVAEVKDLCRILAFSEVEEPSDGVGVRADGDRDDGNLSEDAADESQGTIATHQQDPLLSNSVFWTAQLQLARPRRRSSSSSADGDDPLPEDELFWCMVHVRTVWMAGHRFLIALFIEVPELDGSVIQILQREGIFDRNMLTGGIMREEIKKAEAENAEIAACEESGGTTTSDLFLFRRNARSVGGGGQRPSKAVGGGGQNVQAAPFGLNGRGGAETAKLPGTSARSSERLEGGSPPEQGAVPSSPVAGSAVSTVGASAAGVSATGTARAKESAQRKVSVVLVPGQITPLHDIENSIVEEEMGTRGDLLAHNGVLTYRIHVFNTSDAHADEYVYPKNDSSPVILENDCWVGGLGSLEW